MPMIGRSVIKQLRNRYHETWGRDWPGDNKYLNDIWQEARQVYGVTGSSSSGLKEAYEFCLIAMREAHDFPLNETP